LESPIFVRLGVFLGLMEDRSFNQWSGGKSSQMMTLVP